MTLSRLQLAVGPAATIIEELESDGPRRVFAARAPHETPDGEPSRLVVLHPLPPDGPHPGALLDRMASIRAVSHEGLASPLATGDFEGAAWVVEPFPRGRSPGPGAAWSTADAAQSLREAARALAALHRRGLHHGALVADAMLLKGDHMVIHHLGRSTVGSVADDLYRLGAIISSSLPRHREGALPALHVLLGRMTDPDRGRRPDSAEEVLAALDPLPGRGNDRGLLIAGAPHDSRAVVAPRHLMIVAAVLVTMLLAWWLMRAVP